MKIFNFVISAVLSVVLALAVSEFVTRAPVSASVGVPMFAASRGFGGGGVSNPTLGCLDNELVKADGTTGNIQCEDSVTVTDAGQITAASHVVTQGQFRVTDSNVLIAEEGTNSMLIQATTDIAMDSGSGIRMDLTDDGTDDLTITESGTDGVQLLAGGSGGRIIMNGASGADFGLDANDRMLCDSNGCDIYSGGAVVLDVDDAGVTITGTLDTTGNIDVAGGTVTMGSGNATIVSGSQRMVLSPVATYGVDIGTTGAKATCDATNDGSFFYENTNADSTAGILYMCMENASDVYSWNTIHTGT